MNRWLTVGVILVLLALASAQVCLGREGAAGPLPFDPKTIETVQGLVVDAPVVHKGGIPEMEHLILETKREKLTVVLGPNWFLAQQNWNITTLDRIEVTGSRFTLDKKPAMIAQKVKKGEQVFEFRDPSGRPLWAPPRAPAQ